MSKKRAMSKQQRLYYEYQNKDRIREELAELAKNMREVDSSDTSLPTSNPHRSSYFY
jgi:hypothetical protein